MDAGRFDNDRFAERAGPREDGAGVIPLEHLAQAAEDHGEAGAKADDVRLLGDALLQQDNAATIDVRCLALTSGGRDHPSHIAQCVGQLGTELAARWGQLEDLFP